MSNSSGHSVNSFEVIQLFREGVLQKPPPFWISSVWIGLLLTPANKVI